MKHSPVVMIMAGGSGTRLWPLSREKRPKQLLALYSHKSLIRETYDRALLLTDKKSIFIGTGEKYRKAIARELNISRRQFILEPEGKNTAPIIALFVKQMARKKKTANRPLVILSADHFISNVELWRDTVLSACADNNHLICLGIKPTRPDTGYGYIESGEKLNGALHKIISFKEKPDIRTAEQYIRSGNFLWNSGMFIFPQQLLLSELARHAPEIDKLTDIAQKSAKKLKKSFRKMPNISIDYALLEKSDRLAVIHGDFIWDDVGSFEAIVRTNGPDAAGNYPGPGTAYRSIGSENNIMYASKPIALLGAKNLVVVETEQVLLIAERSSLGDIKKIREQFPEYF